MLVSRDDALGLLVLEFLMQDESPLLEEVVSERGYVSHKDHVLDPILGFGSVLKHSLVVLVKFPSLNLVL